MKASELKSKSEAELSDELQAMLKLQFQNRMARGMGQLTRTHEIRQVRRNIARIKTVLTQMHTAGKV